MVDLKGFGGKLSKKIEASTEISGQILQSDEALEYIAFHIENPSFSARMTVLRAGSYYADVLSPEIHDHLAALALATGRDLLGNKLPVYTEFVTYLSLLEAYCGDDAKDLCETLRIKMARDGGAPLPP